MKYSEIKIREIPVSVKARLKKMAKENGRSMEKQALWILKEAVK